MGSIFLVGFMGCGKTTVGKVMAERLDRCFLDLDDAIEDHFGTSIKEVFSQHGEDVFRSEETRTLLRVATGPEVVVATGGGCFCSQVNRNIISDSGGWSVFLMVPWQVIRRRLSGNCSDRPRFRNEVAAHTLYREREPWYRLADLTLELTGDEPPAWVAGSVLEALAEVECAS